MSIDAGWARTELEKFVDLTARQWKTSSLTIGGGRYVYKGTDEEIASSAYVVEQIFDRVLPNWRTAISSSLSNQWARHREAAVRAIVALGRNDEIRRGLGDDTPVLSAGVMHPWVWSGAKALWQSGHRREAVTAAARQVNAETQNKVGRRDVSEINLFKQVFTLDEPKPNQPRLRVMKDDGGETYKNIHRGLMALAEGCFAAIRNPNSHEANLQELPEHEALEQLAVFSFLARQVDAAQVVTS